MVKALFSGYKNPRFATITEYVEDALKSSGFETLFFNNRDFIVPGRFRDRLPFLNNWDLRRINNKLIDVVKDFSPDLFLETGGNRILPGTVETIKEAGAKTVLWTTDAPIYFEPVLKAAPHYDYIFTAGSEAYDILKDSGVANLHGLPFACDPLVHKPVVLSEAEHDLYGCDIAFVGSIHPDLYPFRIKVLEALSAYKLGIWGPGVEHIAAGSPLHPFVRGGDTVPEVWTKIYAASKIVLCMHYRDPLGIIPCHQASPRVYEAMACGAFLLVDNQRDIFRLFQDREDLVIFNDVEELRGLVEYYLGNPEERRAVAAQGRKTVLERHTYAHRVEEIVCTVGAV